MAAPVPIDTRAFSPRVMTRTRKPIWARVLLKIAEIAVLLLVTSLIVFLATQALPGDVVTIILGVDTTPERAEALRTQLGLDQPLPAQYWSWLSGVLHGDFGTSLITGRPVNEIIGLRVRNSIVLGLTAFAIMIPVSLVLGVAAAYFRDRALDRGFLTVSMVLNATPEFVTGTLLIALLSTNVLRIFPPVAQFPPQDLPWQHPDLIFLPVLTLVIGGSMYLSRLIRVSYIDVLSSEYVEMARLKGVGTWRVLFRHALPNALAPAIPAAMIVAAFVIGGVVVVEYLYAYPGMGSMVIEAARNRDLPVLQALILIIAVLYFAMNLIGDLLSGANRGERR